MMTDVMALKLQYLERALRHAYAANPTPDERCVIDTLAQVIRGDTPDVRFPLPEWLYPIIHLLTIQAAIDIVIVGERGKVLYESRNDRWFEGWELVGGYGRTHFRTLGEWCSYLAARDIGAEVKLLGFAGLHLWKLGEHAHGVPLSMVAVCRLTSPPTKKLDKLSYFAKVPEGMVPNHGKFVVAGLEALDEDRLMPEIL